MDNINNIKDIIEKGAMEVKIAAAESFLEINHKLSNKSKVKKEFEKFKLDLKHGWLKFERDPMKQIKNFFIEIKNFFIDVFIDLKHFCTSAKKATTKKTVTKARSS